MRIIIYWHTFHSSGFHYICNFKCRHDCRYSPQNIFNATNFNPHKKPISLLNVPICTQGMQRTWWPEAGIIIVTGPYWRFAFEFASKLSVVGQIRPDYSYSFSIYDIPKRYLSYRILHKFKYFTQNILIMEFCTYLKILHKNVCA